MKNENRQDRQIRWKRYADLLSNTTLGLFLSIGVLLSWFHMASFSDGFYRSAAGIALVMVLAENLCLAFFPKKKNWFFALPVLVAFLLALLAGWARVAGGARDYLNIMIAFWNEKYHDNLLYLGDVSVTKENLSLICLILLLACIALNSYFMSRRKLIPLFCLVVIYFLPGIILEQSSMRGSISLLLSICGIWLFFLQAGSRFRRIMWFLVLMSGMIFIYFTAPEGKSESVRFVEQEIWQTMGQLRYGKDTLPEGNLYRACEMEDGTKVTLRISTDHIKNMYFQGFTGAVYRDGQWKSLKKNIYAGERRGFLQWMNEQGVDPNSQYVSYQRAGNHLVMENPDETQIEKNQVSVRNEGANRRYIYTPYSAEKPDGDQIAENKDSGYISKKFFGSRSYEFTEYSQNVPGELQRLDSWAYSPESEEQNQYLQAESVYRDFVYEYYLDENHKLSERIKKMFHPEDESGNAQTESIYEVTQRIRTKLKNSTRYHPMPKENFAGEDPLLRFLEGKQSGNSAFYASAGVLAFRSFGIPARYAEGYFLNTNRDEMEAHHGNPQDGIELTAQNTHAWVEVYADGIGWLPIDVTPGFYYDTYTLLQLSEIPQKIKKTAALDNEGDQAEETLKKGTEDGGKSGEEQQRENGWLDIIWGSFLCILFIIEGIWIVLEIRRAIYEYQIYHCMDQPDVDRTTEFLFDRIQENLWACGIEMQPGWKREETQSAVHVLLPDVSAGMYGKINDLMEKYFYGGISLEADERRLLWNFLLQLRRGRRNLSLHRRIRQRLLFFGNLAVHR